MFFLCGDKDFRLVFKDFFLKYNIPVLEISDTENVYKQLEKNKPDGILIQTGVWNDVAVDIAALKPDIRVFASGPADLDTWAKFIALNITIISENPEKAFDVIKQYIDKLPAKPLPKEKAPVHSEKRNSDVLLVYSAKGGVGKTTIANNIAAALGIYNKKKKTALLDFNLDGSTGIYNFCKSNQKPKTAVLFADIKMPAVWEDVCSCMNYHELSNVYYLAPPISSQEKTEFGADLVDKIMAISKEFFDYIIIDMGVAILERNSAIQAISSSSEILYVSSFDPDTIKLLTDAYKNEIRYLIDNPSKMSLVINDVHPSWYSVKDLVLYFSKETGSAIKFKSEFSHDPVLEKYKGRGGPLICFEPNSAFSKDIKNFVRERYGINFKSKPGTNFWSRLFARGEGK
jgi:MinD-like ATPase involved in chromosome partitioning or flagellar assembly